MLSSLLMISRFQVRMLVRSFFFMVHFNLVGDFYLVHRLMHLWIPLPMAMLLGLIVVFVRPMGAGPPVLVRVSPFCLV